jgi:hypothetical protein
MQEFLLREAKVLVARDCAAKIFAESNIGIREATYYFAPDLLPFLVVFR